MSSPNLFGDDAATARREAEGADTGPFLLTNAANLFHFLSLGYIGPAESFGPGDNYYGDFLDSAPGRVPLFRGPLNRDLIEHVRRDSQRVARPVVLEFHPDALPPEDVPSLDADGNPVEGLATDLNASVTAPPLVIPFAAVRRVVFLSEADREEVMLQSFENVPEIPADSVSVSEAVIGEAGPGLKAVLPWLGDLDKPLAPTREAFRRADRTAGAVALAARVRPDLEETLLALLRLEDPGSALPNWFALLAADAPDEADADPDALTFAATVSVLRASSPDAWRPREVLEAVWARIADGGLPESEMDQLEKGVDRIRRILTNEDEFTASKSERYPALQGLMLLLIRHEPIPLIRWDPSETRAGADAHLAAAAYAGLLYGHAKLPLKLRDPETDRRIADIVARRLTPLPLPMSIEERVRPTEQEKPVDRDLVSILLDADLEVDGPYRDAAIGLCGYVDWKDCVTSYVVFPDADEQNPAAQYTSQGSKYNKRKLTTWTVPGVVELRYELDVDKFHGLLKTEDIPARDKTRVQRALIEAVQN